MTDTFTCESCGGTFVKARTDEEARAEAAILFPEAAEDNMACVCSHCFKQIMMWAGRAGHA